MHYCVCVKVQLTLQRPGQALRVPGDWGSQDFWTRWQGCQPYTPAAFTRQEYSWYSLLLEAVNPRAMVQPGVCEWKIPMTPTGNQTRNLPARSVVPQPTVPLRTMQVFVWWINKTLKQIWKTTYNFHRGETRYQLLSKMLVNTQIYLTRVCHKVQVHAEEI